MKKLLFLFLITSTVSFAQGGRRIPSGGSAYNELRMKSDGVNLEWKAKVATAPLIYTSSTNAYSVDTTVIATIYDLGSYIPNSGATVNPNLNQKNITNINSIDIDSVEDNGNGIEIAVTGDTVRIRSNEYVDIYGSSNGDVNIRGNDIGISATDDVLESITDSKTTNADTVYYNINGIAIGQTASSAPNTSSLVDIRSTTKGFLPPRMTTVQRDAIVSPAEGLIIMDLTTHKLNFYDGTSWIVVP